MKLAESNEHYPKWRLGAIIVKGGSVLSVGQSKLRTHPSLCDLHNPDIKGRISLHAEMDALKRCGNAKGAVLYVARIGRAGHIRLAKPCLSCQKELVQAGIKRVVYTMNNERFGTWPPER